MRATRLLSDELKSKGTNRRQHYRDYLSRYGVPILLRRAVLLSDRPMETQSRHGRNLQCKRWTAIFNISRCFLVMLLPTGTRSAQKRKRHPACRAVVDSYAAQFLVCLSSGGPFSQLEISQATLTCSSRPQVHWGTTTAGCNGEVARITRYK